jgi:hypothetical protein
VEYHNSPTAVRLFLGGIPSIFTKAVDATAKKSFIIFPAHMRGAPIESAPLRFECQNVFAAGLQVRAFVFRCSQTEAHLLFAIWLQNPHAELSEW